MDPAIEGTHETATGLAIVHPVNPETLIAKAIEHGATIDVLERVFALREKLKAEHAREQFFAALGRFQAACPIIPKTKTAKIEGARGSYSYSYAPLEVIVKYVQPILEAQGLSVTFDTRIENGGPQETLVSICTVHHVAGHSESSDFRVPIDKAARMNDAQKVASASTYAKRYAYCNALGILTGDDDDDAHLGGTRGDEKPTGGPTEFTPPKRASETKPPPPRAEREPGSDDVEPPKPEDAISEAKVTRVHALIGQALKAARLEDNAENHEAVCAELDRMVQANRGRAKWQFLSWKGKDYDSLCGKIPLVVEKLWPVEPPKPAARLVRPRR